MAGRQYSFERNTSETEVAVRLDLDSTDTGSVPVVEVSTGVPFFDHMLHAMGFHGGLGLQVTATGDLLVDAHPRRGGRGHRAGRMPVPGDGSGLTAHTRFGACGGTDGRCPGGSDRRRGRPLPTAGSTPAFPQERAGDFDVWLLREFFTALAGRARINVHASVRYGDNSHHMAEALCKALGRALGQAFRTAAGREPRLPPRAGSSRSGRRASNTARMRRTPPDDDCSLTIRNAPSSPVRLACGPPHTSWE